MGAVRALPQCVFMLKIQEVALVNEFQNLCLFLKHDLSYAVPYDYFIPSEILFILAIPSRADFFTFLFERFYFIFLVDLNELCYILYKSYVCIFYDFCFCSPP